MTPSARGSSKDHEAIQNRAHEFAAAWNRHDARAMAAAFAEDGDLIDPFGRVCKSRSEVENLLRQQHAGPLKDSRYTQTIEGIRMLSPDLAICDTSAEVAGAKDPSGKPTTLKAHVTMVLKKNGDSWQVVASRPAVPLPAPGH